MKILLTAIILTLTFTTANAKEYLEKVESEVIQMKGTKQEIFDKGKNCIVDNVNFDGVHMSDSAGAGLFAGALGSTSKASNIQGGQVIAFAEIESGKIVANSRVDYTQMMTANNAQSKLTLIAKEGRFKIRHTNIKYLQKSTGYTKNTGYKKVGMWWGAGSGAVKTALEDVTQKLVSCMTGIKMAGAEEEEEDW